MTAGIQVDQRWVPALATLGLSVPLILLVLRGTKQNTKIILLFCLLISAAVSWFSVVSNVVQEPYLDEIFHIPQAQIYCKGKFLEWDDKITTPPGLYICSILLQRAAIFIGKPWLFDCDASSLRVTNVIGLAAVASLALLCRHTVEARLYEAHSSARLQRVSTYSIHTAFNIALFPLLFFFSGLYYTDVISTAAVMGAYLNHLKRVGRDTSSFFSDLLTILLGVVALFMRQTNVFWIVVYLGGLEAVHAVKTLRPDRVDQPYMTTLSEQLKFFVWRYSVGDIHDLPLSLAWPDDMLFTVVSLGIAALCNPIRLLRQIWPYISVLLAFGAFVSWNGGVVLGDKSNHVATVHLAQLLYIWPFFAFFSLPLLAHWAIPVINGSRMLFGSTSKGSKSSNATSTGSRSKKTSSARGSKAREPTTRAPQPSATSSTDTPRRSKPLLFMEQLFNTKFIIWALYLLFTMAASVAIVKYNTIVHPFTLADNRHYMFYIFRYTIRRGQLIRFLLIIPYTISRWLVWGTFAGCTDWMFWNHSRWCSTYYQETRPAPYTSNPFWIAAGLNKRQTNTSFPAYADDTQQIAVATNHESPSDDPLLTSVEPTSTSTGLIFLLATTLSLMTAPLVEPRYFIIPWVMWRLLVPAWRVHDHRIFDSLFEDVDSGSWAGKALSLCRQVDMRLFLETLWFVAINLVTGYIFITKPYIWKDENGVVLDDGRLQRFMW